MAPDPSVPPHDREAEATVLGDLLARPESADAAFDLLDEDDFYVPEHRAFFALCRDLHLRHGQLDLEIVRAGVAARRLAPPDRALYYVTSFFNGSRVDPWMFRAHAAPLKDLRRRRELWALNLDLAKGLESRAELPALEARLQSACASPSLRPDAPAVLKPLELLRYDTERDPRCLLGRRWLCQGASVLLNGPAGVGKSSLLMQAALLWALGRDFFGLAPVRPLRSLIVQAENDPGDLSEHFKGVVNHLGLAAHAGELDERLLLVTETCRAGAAFLAFVRRLVAEYRPDLVWVDPLLAYLGGDVSDQKTVGPFLRNGLNPIGQEFGCAWLVINHFAKPRDPAFRKALVGGERAYLGIGSSELTNWPRAVLNLREVEDGLFELAAVKRGGRALFTDADAQPTTVLHLKYARRGICWERAETPQDPRAKQVGGWVELVLEEMKGKTLTKSQLRDLVREKLAVAMKTMYRVGSVANRVWETVMTSTGEPQHPGYYAVKEDCHPALLHK